MKNLSVVSAVAAARWAAVVLWDRVRETGSVNAADPRTTPVPFVTVALLATEGGGINGAAVGPHPTHGCAAHAGVAVDGPNVSIRARHGDIHKPNRGAVAGVSA